MTAALSQAAPRSLLNVRVLGWVLLGWSLVAIALAVTRSIDLARAGTAESLWRSWWVTWPRVLPFMLYSVAVAVLLRARPGLLLRPAPLLLAGLVATPLYVLVSRPLTVAIRYATSGLDWARYASEVMQPQRVDVWIVSVMLLAGLAAQLGIAWLRHSQQEEEEALRSEAANLQLRLQLLQGQLEPHFMFNTLNSIAALVRGADRAVGLSALTRLSELLRYSLRASQQQWVSVADELRFVEDYVALQRLRFGDALRWQAQVEAADWARWACAPLLLQPLVENAIRYGLESGEPGAVTFSVRALGERLQIQLNNPRSPDAHLMAGHGVGLAKTRERVHMLYGEQGDLSTDARPDAFHLTLNLPLRDLDGTLESFDR